MSPKFRWFALLCPTLFGFDFWSKEATRSLAMYEQVPVIPGWLSFTHHENPFVAFSVPIPYAMIVGVAVLGVAVMVHHLTKLRPEARLQAAGLAAMVAGALGNLFDRLVDGTVTDMVMIYTQHPRLAPWLVETVGTSTWPIFNVADMALLGGVAAYLAGSATEGDDEELLVPEGSP